MSKKMKSTLSTGTNDNDAQLKATQEIIDNYDHHAARILRSEQIEVNRKLQQQRDEHHQSYQEIEAKANAILQQAHREGEVHVVERHRKTASIFFIQDEKKIMMWSEGSLVEVPYPEAGKDSKIKALKASDWILPGVQLQKGDEQLASLMYLIEGTQSYAYVSVLVKNGEKYFLRSGLFHSHPSPIPDVFIASNGWFGYSHNDSIWGLWRKNATSNSGKDFSTLISPQIPAPLRSIISHVETISDNLNFYFIRKNSIFLVEVKMNGNKIDAHTVSNPMDEKHLDTPIDLSYNREHNSLLIQDAGKRNIGIHLLGIDKERIWRSFHQQSQITLPPGVFQLDKTWTLSCLIKRNCQQELSKDYPQYNAPFKIWVDKDTGLLKLQYQFDKDTHVFTSPEGNKFTDFRYSDWFLFSMQREGNEIRFYRDGELFWTHQSIDFPSLRESKLLFSLTGYFLCELRVWRTIRTVEELKRYKRTWLPHSAFTGLTGYWHLFVIGKENTGLMLNTFDKNGEKSDSIQEPDLSGNGHHLYTSRGPNVVGDLNRETVLEFKTVGPFPSMMPLYELSDTHQGIDIDPYAGRIYWVDEIGDTCNRQRVLLMGSTLGHLAPVPLFKINSSAPFTVLSRASSPFTDLIIAHANRRKAMEDQFLGIGNQHRTSHKAVDDAHAALERTLAENIPEEIDNTPEYTAVHDTWLQELDRIANEEEQALRTASARRTAAIAQAQEMTDAAQRRVIAHRRKRE